MQLLKEKKESGLSLKTTSVLMTIASMLIAAVLLYSGVRAFISFRDMEKSTNDYIELAEAASELMEASDYLTEEVQRYTVMGDRTHMENYFTEAEETRRREKAIEKMQEKLPDSSALNELREGMKESVSLMDREYYAMRLMMEAAGEAEMPEALMNTELTETDSALDPEAKISLARSTVHDPEYYEQKNRIRRNMSECVTELKNGTHGSQKEMEGQAYRDLIIMAALIVIQTVAVFAMMWLTRHLGVNPVLRAVDHIRQDETIPITGASEFRYLASTYNTMYNAYKKSIDRLNFKASHDELTGAFNRAGYELILSGLDCASTAMLVFDADCFKGVNDSCGHEAGDRVLKRITDTLKRNFRSDDYVCRIGGDEFAVLMVHVSPEAGKLIEQKVVRINRELSENTDGVPQVTLSAGVSFGVAEDPAEMFRRADVALYYVKEHGRNGCCFWTPELDRKLVWKENEETGA